MWKKRHHRLSTSQKPTASSTTFKDYQLPVQKLMSLAPSDKRKVERDISHQPFTSRSTERNHHTRESGRLHRKHTVTQGRSNLTKGVGAVFQAISCSQSLSEHQHGMSHGRSWCICICKRQLYRTANFHIYIYTYILYSISWKHQF